eukprot:scaffold327869_cov71-Tisochrysis_lutea.AAC.1
MKSNPNICDPVGVLVLCSAAVGAALFVAVMPARARGFAFGLDLKLCAPAELGTLATTRALSLGCSGKCEEPLQWMQCTRRARRLAGFFRFRLHTAIREFTPGTRMDPQSRHRRCRRRCGSFKSAVRASRNRCNTRWRESSGAVWACSCALCRRNCKRAADAKRAAAAASLARDAAAADAAAADAADMFFL